MSRMSEIDATISAIAKKHLSIQTLETRNSDSLDFHSVSVWAIKQALYEAYTSPYTCKECGEIHAECADGSVCELCMASGVGAPDCN